MPRILTDDQVTQFRLNGHISVEDVLTPDEVGALAEHCDFIATGAADHIPDTSIQLEKVFREGEREVEDQVLSVRKLYNLAVYDDIMWSHVTHPKIVDIIADLLDTDDLKLYGDQLFMKAPKTGTAQGWHQDSASWRDILPMDLVSAWTAIDNATPENGCLNFAPGTHRWGMLGATALRAGTRAAPILEDMESGGWPVVPAPLRAGSISFHHSLVFHQSNANLSGRRRRGYATHYMRATSVKDEAVTDAPKMPLFKQVRGKSFEGRV